MYKIKDINNLSILESYGYEKVNETAIAYMKRLTLEGDIIYISHSGYITYYNQDDLSDLINDGLVEEVSIY